MSKSTHEYLVHMCQNKTFFLEYNKFFRKLFASNGVKMKSFYINLESVKGTNDALLINCIYLHLINPIFCFLLDISSII